MELGIDDIVTPSIERDYRKYIEAETGHLIIKMRKAIERSKTVAALAHASRYHFLSSNAISPTSTVEEVIQEALKNYAQRGC